MEIKEKEDRASLGDRSRKRGSPAKERKKERKKERMKRTKERTKERTNHQFQAYIQWFGLQSSVK